MRHALRSAAALFAVILAVAPAATADDEAGYYYPPVGSSEVFDRTLAETPNADRSVRIGFVTTLTRQQLDKGYAPRFVMFAKGAESEELIAVALDDEIFATLFRARAVMAQMSAPSRVTQFFVENDLTDRATFYDMLKIMGFRSLTLSDGRSWSHRVDFR